MKNPSRLAAPLKIIALTCLAVSLALTLPAASGEPTAGIPDADGTFHVPAFLLPESSLLDEETRAALKNRIYEKIIPILFNECLPKEGVDKGRQSKIDQCVQTFYRTAFYQRLRERYPVTLTPQTMGGVYTEILTPAQGIANKSQSRVLINLHSGGFGAGARTASLAESIPIASVGKIKVVSVDYRMAPTYEFPAASEDVEAVYRELLKTYKPQSIGIYGCSAGGLLTAEVVAWLQWKGLPRPGAVGMFCGTGLYYYGEGDSGYVVSALKGIPSYKVPQDPYFKDVDINDSLAFPMRSDETMEAFPPSLLITSTRDQTLSSVVYAHSRLVALGVDAELHVWEGLEHGFFWAYDLPQSREVYDVTVKFFDQHLGRPPKPSRIEPQVQLEQTLQRQVSEFVEMDKASPPPSCEVLFVGSSSIAVWKTLARDMAPLPVINRGFGGSHIEYVNRWFDKVVAPYRPRAIVFYAGENDIGAGKPVERVLADFDEFMKRKHAALGETPVYFISVKPSKLRWWQFGLQAQVNDAIRARAKTEHDLHYIDVASLMLDHGRPKDIYGPDHLHMSAEGYAIWTKAVKAVLLADTQAELQSCQRDDHH